MGVQWCWYICHPDICTMYNVYVGWMGFKLDHSLLHMLCLTPKQALLWKTWWTNKAILGVGFMCSYFAQNPISQVSGKLFREKTIVFRNCLCFHIFLSPCCTQQNDETFLTVGFWGCLLKCVKWFGKWGRNQMEQKGGKRGLPRSTDLHYLLLLGTDSTVAIFTFRQWQKTTDSNRQQQTATGQQHALPVSVTSKGLAR